MKFSAIRKAWEILDRRERRNAIIVLGIMVISAFAAAGMVGSIFPFLTVLSDPALIRGNRYLATAFRIGVFSDEFEFVIALGLGSIVVIGISSFLQIINVWAVTRFTQMRSHTFSSRLLGYYLSQPYEFFLNRHSGDMSSAILSEADRAVREFIYPLMLFISSILTVLSIVTILILVNPTAAISAFFILGSIYALTSIFTKNFVSRLGEERAKANEERFRIAGEALGGVKVIKLLGRELRYLTLYNNPSLSYARTHAVVNTWAQSPRFVIQIVGFGGMIVLALALLDQAQFGNRDALAGLLPLLGLLAFAGQRLLPELQAAYNAITTLNAGSAALDRVHADLSANTGRGLVSGNPAPLQLTNSLTLSEVSYTYPGADRSGLDRVSFKVRAGERIGIIGPSGAGKTTLADVMLGLLQPQSGELCVDDATLTQENMRAWQRAVGYVPQDIFLTDASVAENIALGLSPREIEHDKIERAARSALLHEFVMSELPDGYSTRIGERGVRLSGGQRQRIGIARALYHDANLILFDEATSALDNLTEAEVMKAIDALPGETTIILIAHRFSTVRRCDRIIMLGGGRVAAVGSWDELNSSSAAFRALTHAG